MTHSTLSLRSLCSNQCSLPLLIGKLTHSGPSKFLSFVSFSFEIIHPREHTHFISVECCAVPYLARSKRQHQIIKGMRVS